MEISQGFHINSHNISLLGGCIFFHQHWVYEIHDDDVQMSSHPRKILQRKHEPVRVTLSETKMAPENGWLEWPIGWPIGMAYLYLGWPIGMAPENSFLLGWPLYIFSGYVKLREAMSMLQIGSSDIYHVWRDS